MVQPPAKHGRFLATRIPRFFLGGVGEEVRSGLDIRGREKCGVTKAHGGQGGRLKIKAHGKRMTMGRKAHVGGEN